MAQYKGAASEAGRAMHLMKKREKQREQMEQMKQRIAEENIMKSNIDKKFSAHYDAVEAELKSSTVGLVTLNDMKAKQEALVKEREKQLAKKEQSKELQLKLEKLREKERKKEAKRKISSLSFTLEEEDEAGDEEEEATMDDDELEREEITTKKRKLGKNPDVDTSFLPDRDREEEENRLREELRQEWEAKQEKIKSEEIEITFSYWDGSGHRRTVKVTLRGLRPGPHAPRPSGPASFGLGGKELSIPWYGWPLGVRGEQGGGFRASVLPSQLLGWFPRTVSLLPLLGSLTQMKKGNTMQQFLQKALEILRKDFSELRWGCAGAQTPGCTGVCSLSPGARDPRWQLLLAARRAPCPLTHPPSSIAGLCLLALVPRCPWPPAIWSFLPQVGRGRAAHVHQGGPNHTPRESLLWGLRGGSRAVAHLGASRGAPRALGLRLGWAGLEPGLQAAEVAHLPSPSCPLLVAPQLL
uniref:Family with sequence similarity 50 member A n=1 Tax=Phocoena sinus TaxID=42100 RepID=A0A8C9EEL5_PHOSS